MLAMVGSLHASLPGDLSWPMTIEIQNKILNLLMILLGLHNMPRVSYHFVLTTAGRKAARKHALHSFTASSASRLLRVSTVVVELPVAGL